MTNRAGPVRVHQSVELFPPNGVGHDQPGIPSRIADFTEDRIYLLQPKDPGPLNLLPQSPIVLRITRTTPPGEGRYTAETVVERTVVQRGLSLLVVRQPERWHKVQMRGYARAEAALPVRVGILEPGGTPGSWSKSVTTDIGGGGLRVVARGEPPAAGTRVQLAIDLGGETVRAKGKVIRPYTAPDGVTKTVGVEFTEIEERDRERVIQFVFQRQVEMRKKGLL